MWKEAVVTYLLVLSRNLLEAPKKTTKNLGTVGAPAEILTGSLLNKSVERYHLRQQSV
jgi:hypothetical protein